jgi:hypothetical protein
MILAGVMGLPFACEPEKPTPVGQSTGSGGQGGTGGAVGSGGSVGSGGAVGSGGSVGADAAVGTEGDIGADAAAGSGGDMGSGGNPGTGGASVDAGPNAGCDLNGTFAGLNFINTAFVASQYQPSGGIPFKQSACNDATKPFSTVTREGGATGACFAGQVDVAAARTGAFPWVAVAWLHYDAAYNKGYPDPYPIDPAKNAGDDAICLAKKVVVRAKASIDNLGITFAAGDAGWEGTVDVLLKKDSWTEVTIPLSGWVQLPIMRGFYFNIGIIGQDVLSNVNGPVEFFVDSGKYQ